MGMDVYGKNPTSEVGKYFRNNVWWWRPLWDYVEQIAPHLTDGVDGHTNGGDGLSAKNAVRLAKMLTAELESGRTAEYEKVRGAELDAMPDEVCWLCTGAATRTDQMAVNLGIADGRPCNNCHGSGKVRPWATEYPFSEQNVAEFRDFVAASGGFEIW